MPDYPKEENMKKLTAFLLCLCMVFCLVSCGGEKTPYEIAKEELEKSNMSKSELSSSELAEFETRFSKLGLEKGISRACHFKSQTQYAYLVEFESAADAEIVYTKFSASQYDMAQSGNTVVYGKSAWIADIPFNR
ncbi:MAG TPA: hypothetical protein DDY70_01720 [Clostridiales bacterium]|nr:hypothetical protein [Clostridiales bacterium]